MTIFKKTKTGKCYTIAYWNKKNKRSTQDFATEEAADRFVEKLVNENLANRYLGICKHSYEWDEEENDFCLVKTENVDYQI